MMLIFNFMQNEIIVSLAFVSSEIFGPKKLLCIFLASPLFQKWCNVLLLAYVALLTQFLHSASTSLLTTLEYHIALGVSILSLSFLILAAIGIRSNRSFALVPLFTLQTTSLFFFGLTWGHTTFVLVKEQGKSWPPGMFLCQS